MRILEALLKCFLVAVTIGSAVGDGLCIPETGEQADLPLYRTLPRVAKSCVDALKGNTSALEGKYVATEAIQSYFNTMCPDLPTFRECLAEKATSLEVCSNPNTLKTFNILRDMMLKTVEIGCAEGGKLFVTLMKGLVAIADNSSIADQVNKCGEKSGMILGIVHKSSVDISSKIFIVYRELRKFVECVSKIQIEELLREVVDFYLNEMTTTMKCIHPQDATLVTCDSISADLISAKCICCAKKHGSKLALYEMLENDAGNCVYETIRRDKGEKDISADNEALREHFKELCERRALVERCTNEPRLIAETCLNETQNNEFKHFLVTFDTGLDAACVEDGRRLADIMFEVYRLKRTGQGHAVWGCIDVAKSTRNEIDEHRGSSKNMRFYHEMEAFKTCLVGKLHGDQTSVDAATSLIDEMLKKVECVGAEDGATATCESLMRHSHGHEHNHNHDHEHSHH